MGAPDSEGVYLYTEDDLAAPGDGFSEMLNKAPSSVSTQLAEIRGRGIPFTFSASGDLEVKAGTHRQYNDVGRELVIDTVRVAIATAPTGSAVLVDVNLDTVSILAASASVADGGHTTTAAPTTTVWPVGSYLTVDVDQVGATTPGVDLTVTVWAH